MPIHPAQHSYFVYYPESFRITPLCAELTLTDFLTLWQENYGTKPKLLEQVRAVARARHLSHQKEIQEGLNKLYADEKNWQSDWKKPYSNEVQNFISEAVKCAK